MKKTVKYLTEEITKGGADIKKYYDEKANEVYSYLEENPYALILAGDILANDKELSGIKAISQAMTMVENAKINYGETFNDNYDIFTQDEDTEEFVKKVSGSIADLEVYELVEKDKGWFSKSRIESERKDGRGSKDYIARIERKDFRALRFDPVDGSIRATFLDDDKQRTNIVIPITGKNASKILPIKYVQPIQKVANFLDPDSFFRGEGLSPDGTRTINFMGVDYVMRAVQHKGSLMIEIEGFDSQGNHYTEEDLYEDYVAFVHKALTAKSKSYSDK